jgi:hypothetical protein
MWRRVLLGVGRMLVGAAVRVRRAVVAVVIMVGMGVEWDLMRLNLWRRVLLGVGRMLVGAAVRVRRAVVAVVIMVGMGVEWDLTPSLSPAPFHPKAPPPHVTPSAPPASLATPLLGPIPAFPLTLLQAFL